MSNITIAVAGLGYVGLPLAVEFGKKYHTIGYDLSEAKVESYKNYRDPTGEVSSEELRAARRTVSNDPSGYLQGRLLCRRRAHSGGRGPCR